MYRGRRLHSDNQLLCKLAKSATIAIKPLTDLWSVFAKYRFPTTTYCGPKTTILGFRRFPTFFQKVDLQPLCKGISTIKPISADSGNHGEIVPHYWGNV
jgi:hypothetical protein